MHGEFCTTAYVCTAMGFFLCQLAEGYFNVPRSNFLNITKHLGSYHSQELLVHEILETSLHKQQVVNNVK
jgi:hypothetical protein